MIAKEVTLSVEEWLNVGENTKRLLVKNSPIKSALDKTLINISSVQREYAIKQHELVKKYAKDDGNGGIATKVPGKDNTNIDDILFTDEKAFKEELEALLISEVTLTAYKVTGELEYPYNGVLISLKGFLEINTVLPAVDCLFLLEYYID